jgi:hypothetical protein
MRRLLAILLLAAFGLPVAAPLIASGQDLQTNLPICCRRNGVHRCTTMTGAERSNQPTISAHCANFPQQGVPAPHLTLTALIATQPSIRLPLAELSAPARAETQRRISRERSRHKRGPPAATLAA